MRRVPARHIEPELLDGQLEDTTELRENLRDMSRANRLLLSNRSIVQRIEAWADQMPAQAPITILDVATGIGELPRAIAQWARRSGRPVRLLASDRDPAIIAAARRELQGLPIRLAHHDALHMPFVDASVEIVTCAFALHHFSPDVVVGLLHEMARVARIGVIVTDLRRSHAAYWGARLLALGMNNRLTRHDGPVSVLRAYTASEARAFVAQAGLRGMVCAEPIFRLAITLDQARRPAHS